MNEELEKLVNELYNKAFSEYKKPNLTKAQEFYYQGWLHSLQAIKSKIQILNGSS